MTRYYLDTEFLDDGEKITLISIGVVSDDGRELYFASTEWLGNDGKPDLHPSPHVRADDWLRDNVFSQIPSCSCPGIEDWRQRPHHHTHEETCRWRSREEIRDAVRAFIHEEPRDQIEIWAYFASSDWVVFYQLFGKMIDMPKHFPFFVRCLKQYALDLGYTGKFKELLPDTGHHDALADARWNRDVHKLLLERFAYLKQQTELAKLTFDKNRIAGAIADKLLADLNDRAGFAVDGDAREMIRPDWIKLITEGLAQP